MFLSTSDKYTSIFLLEGKTSVVLQLEQMGAFGGLISYSLLALCRLGTVSTSDKHTSLLLLEGNASIVLH